MPKPKFTPPPPRQSFVKPKIDPGPLPGTAQWIKDYNQKIDDIIKTKGWAVQGVGSDEFTMGYAYSVGRSILGQPEVIVRGGFAQVIYELLNESIMALNDQKIAAYVVGYSNNLATGGKPLRYMLKPVAFDQIDGLMGAAINRYGAERMQANGILELFYGNAENKLPGE